MTQGTPSAVMGLSSLPLSPAGGAAGDEAGALAGAPAAFEPPELEVDGE